MPQPHPDRTVATRFSGPMAVLVTLGRPLLAFHLEMYRRDLASAVFPRDERSPAITGPSPERIAFIGSIAVAGMGVLSHGMTTSSQVASRVAHSRGRGLTWSELTSPVLTARTAVTMSSLSAEGASAAVVFLGIADVLSATSPSAWERDLRLLVGRIRQEAGEECAVVFAAIPPMAQFRPIPPLASRLITGQVDRLNAVTERLSRELIGVDHVDFPLAALADMTVRDLFSWSTLHRRWAEIVAPRVHAALIGVDARRRVAHR
ncbi:GDSL-type esterase/lipase family protein [Frigoribacterium sp. CFBP 13712]|uniref:GDSL-type esterase/lipase family protein n=1 Tax=Frigoribacterium sp. CFBP 13712 TaxID=2775309 RepID=UPI00177A87A3|nr:GDSL-type esterase/lipase family protein [Frigoribacterium sp. CFBP 13712]MBD8704698.1 esterase [Frigoribacterium sp. CFBP 13712]